ncbi:magnesium transporter [Chitinophaga niastensis]|uniref:Magnesium transporter MgtE n=1 Tax=Chitinophaga niastensis TaxID=536980 RepID=A0A2P8H9N0_CHINA|nr:magnesium transporter [Chitinophaga niastensis]PSL42890.1 magnesium transporter [Chitinophaga niastensis]
MMNLKEISKKIRNGDFSSLLGLSNGNKRVHPAEVARMLASVSTDKSVEGFMSLPLNKQTEVFAYLDSPLQKRIISTLNNTKAAYILNELSSDDRIAFYSSLTGVQRSAYLEFLDEKNKEVIHNVLGYPKNSVARLINTDFATIDPDITIAQANEHLRKYHRDTEAANVIYVVDKDGKLVDDIPIRRFVLNDPEKKISDILDGFCVSLKMTDKKEDAVAKFKEYDRVVLPVINTDNILLGVLTVDDVLDVAEQRDTKEIQNFGGVEGLDYPYVKTGFFSLIKKRATWLIVLFIGEMLTATAMGYFDKEISKAVVLALFVPLIISSGGNSGSQAATLIIRAMALKELTIRNWWFVMRREILSGLTLGFILGAIGFVRIAVWQNLHFYEYGSHWFLLALTIFFSLIGIVMWGTLSGSMIPIILKKVRLDPATSSAPLVATLVDVTGLVIYFSIAAIILKGTLL